MAFGGRAKQNQPMVETEISFPNTEIASRVVIELIDLSVSVIRRGSQASDTVYDGGGTVLSTGPRHAECVFIVSLSLRRQLVG